ncbi:hypothetical protein SNEBB_003719 [Seison nebaliae]|nr:hypothetical protein SNEBB_003719 [Seison nebaliae]
MERHEFLLEAALTNDISLPDKLELVKGLRKRLMRLIEFDILLDHLVSNNCLKLEEFLYFDSLPINEKKKSLLDFITSFTSGSVWESLIRTILYLHHDQLLQSIVQQLNEKRKNFNFFHLDDYETFDPLHHHKSIETEMKEEKLNWNIHKLDKNRLTFIGLTIPTDQIDDHHIYLNFFRQFQTITHINYITGIRNISIDDSIIYDEEEEKEEENGGEYDNNFNGIIFIKITSRIQLENLTKKFFLRLRSQFSKQLFGMEGKNCIFCLSVLNWRPKDVEEKLKLIGQICHWQLLGFDLSKLKFNCVSSQFDRMRSIENKKSHELISFVDRSSNSMLMRYSCDFLNPSTNSIDNTIIRCLIYILPLLVIETELSEEFLKNYLSNYFNDDLIDYLLSSDIMEKKRVRKWNVITGINPLLLEELMELYPTRIIRSGHRLINYLRKVDPNDDQVKAFHQNIIQLCLICNEIEAGKKFALSHRHLINSFYVFRSYEFNVRSSMQFLHQINFILSFVYEELERKMICRIIRIILYGFVEKTSNDVNEISKYFNTDHFIHIDRLDRLYGNVLTFFNDNFKNIYHIQSRNLLLVTSLNGTFLLDDWENWENCICVGQNENITSTKIIPIFNGNWTREEYFLFFNEISNKIFRVRLKNLRQSKYPISISLTFTPPFEEEEEIFLKRARHANLRYEERYRLEMMENGNCLNFPSNDNEIMKYEDVEKYFKINSISQFHITPIYYQINEKILIFLHQSRTFFIFLKNWSLMEIVLKRNFLRQTPVDVCFHSENDGNSFGPARLSILMKRQDVFFLVVSTLSMKSNKCLKTVTMDLNTKYLNGKFIGKRLFMIKEKELFIYHFHRQHHWHIFKKLILDHQIQIDRCLFDSNENYFYLIKEKKEEEEVIVLSYKFLPSHNDVIITNELFISNNFTHLQFFSSHQFLFDFNGHLTISKLTDLPLMNGKIIPLTDNYFVLERSENLSQSVLFSLNEGKGIENLFLVDNRTTIRGNLISGNFEQKWLLLKLGGQLHVHKFQIIEHRIFTLDMKVIEGIDVNDGNYFITEHAIRIVGKSPQNLVTYLHIDIAKFTIEKFDEELLCDQSKLCCNTIVCAIQLECLKIYFTVVINGIVFLKLLDGTVVYDIEHDAIHDLKERMSSVELVRLENDEEELLVIVKVSGQKLLKLCIVSGTCMTLVATISMLDETIFRTMNIIKNGIGKSMFYSAILETNAALFHVTFSRERLIRKKLICKVNEAERVLCVQETKKLWKLLFMKGENEDDGEIFSFRLINIDHIHQNIITDEILHSQLMGSPVDMFAIKLKENQIHIWFRSADQLLLVNLEENMMDNLLKLRNRTPTTSDTVETVQRTCSPLGTPKNDFKRLYVIRSRQEKTKFLRNWCKTSKVLVSSPSMRDGMTTTKKTIKTERLTNGTFDGNLVEETVMKTKRLDYNQLI